MRRRTPNLVVAAACLCCLVGCGDDGGPSGDNGTVPEVTATLPDGGAAGVSLIPIVQVWFSEAIDEATLDTLNFYVEGARTHEIEYQDDDHSATLLLSSALEPNNTYDVHLTTGIKNIAGKALGEDYIFSFTTGARDCEHLEDRFEPNDDPATATAIEVDKRYTILSSCGDEHRYDHYSFTLTDTVKVIMRAYYSYADTNSVGWRKTFMRADGEWYADAGTQLTPSEPASYVHSFLPGTYYLRTGKYQADTHMAVYDLVLETSEACQDDAYEDNDFMDEAKPIDPGTFEDMTGCYNDADWFSLSLDVGDRLTVTTTRLTLASPSQQLYIYSSNGDKVAIYQGSDVMASVSWTAVQQETHYIRTQWNGEGVGYNMVVEVAE